METNAELPEGILVKMDAFDNSLGNLEEILKPFLKIPINDIIEKVKDPLQNARLNLMVSYAINSLFWAYLVTQGVNAKNHPIRNELQRIKEYMGKVKLAEERKKMARVDTHAAKRFIRNALWEPPAGKCQKDDGGSSPSNSGDAAKSQQDAPPKKDKKRKKKDNDGEGGEKKKKKKKKTKQE